MHLQLLLELDKVFLTTCILLSFIKSSSIKHVETRESIRGGVSRFIELKENRILKHLEGSLERKRAFDLNSFNCTAYTIVGFLRSCVFVTLYNHASRFESLTIRLFVTPIDFLSRFSAI